MIYMMIIEVIEKIKGCLVNGFNWILEIGLVIIEMFVVKVKNLSYSIRR